MLTRAAILAADDVKFEDVPVPEWSKDPAKPDFVRVRTATAADRLRMSGAGKADASPYVIWIAGCCVDAKGEPLFTQADIPALMQKSYPATERLYNVIERLNGLGAVAVKEAAKN